MRARQSTIKYTHHNKLPALPVARTFLSRMLCGTRCITILGLGGLGEHAQRVYLYCAGMDSNISIGLLFVSVSSRRSWPCWLIIFVPPPTPTS